MDGVLIMKPKIQVVSESGMNFLATINQGIGMKILVIKKATIVKRGGGYPISKNDIPSGFSQFYGKGDFVKMIRD